MRIPTPPPQPPQRRLQHIQILLILATGACTLQDLPRQGVWILRAQELRIRGQANVHETFDGGCGRVGDFGCAGFADSRAGGEGGEGLRGGCCGLWGGLVGIGRRERDWIATYGCWVEGRELDAVAVDFADVEIFADFGDVLRGDVVCGAPDALGGFVLDGSEGMVGE